MKGQLNTELGKVLIDTDVIATYAGSVSYTHLRGYHQQPL